MVIHIKRQWLSALRKNKYKPGRIFLHMQDTYDPLGILADMYIKSKGIQWEQAKDDSGVVQPWFTIHDHAISLPDAIIKWSGLHKKQIAIIATMADLRKKPFEEIADYIEVNI